MAASDQNSTDGSTAKLKRALSQASIVMWIEAAGVGAFTLFMLWGLVSGQSKLAAADFALVVLFAALTAWIAFSAVAVKAGKRWARSSAIFWQTCQIFLATQSFTGRGANAVIGISLLVTAIWVLVNLFSKSVLKDSKDNLRN